MADHFIQFSFNIPDLTATQASQLAAAFSYAAALEAEDRAAITPEPFKDEDDFLTLFADPDFPSFDAVFDGTGIYADTSGDVAAVAKLLHRVGVTVSFEWARTCSKPRPGEFGGGTVHVTPAGVHYFDTHSDLQPATAWMAITEVENDLGASIHDSEEAALISIAETLSRLCNYDGEPIAKDMYDFIDENDLGDDFGFNVHETSLRRPL